MVYEKLKEISLNLRKSKDPCSSGISSVLSMTTQIAKEESKDKSSFEINDEHAIKAIRKSLKQLEDTISSLNEIKNELYWKSVSEKQILSSILPESPSEDDVIGEIRKIIEENSIEKVQKSMGIVMKLLSQKYGNLLDKSVASKLVKEELNV